MYFINHLPGRVRRYVTYQQSEVLVDQPPLRGGLPIGFGCHLLWRQLVFQDQIMDHTTHRDSYEDESVSSNVVQDEIADKVDDVALLVGDQS